MTGSVCELSFAVVPPSGGAGVPRGQREQNAEGHGPEVIDIHLPRHGDDTAGPVRLAHGLIEESGNDAPMRVSGRSGKTAGESRMANNIAGPIDKEVKPQSGAVLLAAAEAMVQRAMGKRRQMSVPGRIGLGHGCGTSLRGTGHRTYGTRAATRRAYIA